MKDAKATIGFSRSMCRCRDMLRHFSEPFDFCMLNKVRRLKDARARYAAAGEEALLAGVPEEDREFVTGIWPPEFERILNGESASMLAQDVQLGKL